MKKHLWWNLLLGSVSILPISLALSCSPKTKNTTDQPEQPQNPGEHDNQNQPTTPENPNNPGGTTNPEQQRPDVIQPGQGGGTPTPENPSSNQENEIPHYSKLPNFSYNYPNLIYGTKADIDQYKKYEERYLNMLAGGLDSNRSPAESDTSKSALDTALAIYNSYSTDQRNAFDSKASELNTPYLLDSLMKNYAVVKDGKLQINPLRIALKRAYEKSAPGDRGKARWLPNELYKKAGLESFSIIFNNSNKELKKFLTPELERQTFESRLELGTAWILDYAVDPSGKYPTKWYIATNLHVAAALVKPAGSTDPYINEPNLRVEAEAVAAALKEKDKATKEFLAVQEEVKKLKELQGPNSPEAAKLEARIATTPVPGDLTIAFTNAANKLKAAEEALKGQTVSVDLYHLKPQVGLKTTLNVTNQDPAFDKVTLNPDQVRIIYAGTDFLTQSPADYLTDPQLKQLQEMADFAVLEVDFSKQKPDSGQSGIGYSFINGTTRQYQSVDSPSDLAKTMTANYANEPDSQRSKPANFDVLQKYKEWSTQTVNIHDGDRVIPVPKINVNFIALGFPNADSDDQINRNGLNDSEKMGLKFTSSLWTNKSKEPGRNPLEYGNSLTKSLIFRMFADAPGVTDITITSPILNEASNQGFNVGALREKDATYQGNRYINYGLGYSLTSWQPLQGSSGSSVRDIDGNLIGINFASADALGISSVSLIQALRSHGVNYNGQYGPYNLAQYDLIYGGGKDQRTSYRQKLQQVYGDGYKTKLFASGSGTIPEEYKFSN